MTAVNEQAARNMARWIRDPVAFVREVFGAEPDAWQAEALNYVANGPQPRTGMSACKGPGKSCLLAWVIWWFMATRIDAQVMALSITEANLRDNLWKELAVWRSKSEIIKLAFDFQKKRIVSRENGHEDTWWVSARAFAQDADPSQQANSLAGFHGDNIMAVLDEMGDYPPGVVAAAEGIFATKAQESRLVAAWNPTSPDGPAYRACTVDRKRWNIVTITGDPDNPKRSSRIDIEWARGEIERWGRDNPYVQVNVLGEFPGHGSNRLIGVNDVMAAMERDAAPGVFRTDARIWGLDPARFGDDEACLMRRQGVVAFTPHVWRSLDGPTLATRVAELILEAERAGEEPDCVFIDVGGVGASAFDHLKLLGYATQVVPIDFGGKASDPRFFDKRTEMWWEMAVWIRRMPSCLPTDPVLQGELTAPIFYYQVVTRQTSLILESKDKMKKRGVPSPNRADALALTFAGPVMPRSRKLEAQLAGSGEIESDYNPLAKHETRKRSYRDPLMRS